MQDFLMVSTSEKICSICKTTVEIVADFCPSCGNQIKANDNSLDPFDDILGATVLQQNEREQNEQNEQNEWEQNEQNEQKRPKINIQLGNISARAQRSGISKTVEIDALPENQKTEIYPKGREEKETLEVQAVPEQAAVPLKLRHSHSTTRWLPLAIIVGISLLLITLVAIRLITQETSSALAREAVDLTGNIPVEIELPAVTTIVGMTDDNKEAWMSLCFRVSERPQTECRLSHLRELGEYPAQSVDIPPLVADALEVTNAFYLQCVEQGICSPIELEGCRFYSVRGYEFSVAVPEVFTELQRPAVCVSYEQASTYCASRDMRLPNTNEWERLARGDGDGIFPWRGSYWAPGILNWGERDMTSYPIFGLLDGAEFTAESSEYEEGASSEGILNLLGNAAEWVAPNDDTEAGVAFMMGGSYIDNIRSLRVTAQEEVRMTQRRSTLGFRCIREQNEQP